ncbi:LytTR family transcriptional regulator DNA-binding domain-containing protein [Lactiplantibacillus nangangensis]|uniref:LytTR family transcriptional regulator DNA-binding domain-containing protein n=1 Tax=Lactiplantibacillus nangangensis TaxID=2559917 RepID=A0ABW1SK36_9LACO|nr:LytTR family transcriptional regulator DNA-binding domain-containing protein [Lactiplantibacillus nangangensis]
MIICEDNPELLNLYTIIIKKYMTEHPNDPLRLRLATTNPNEVESVLKPQHYPDTIFLLDIEFANSKIRGIDLATTIRQHDAHAKIIFITTHEELKPLTFQRKINPLDSINKEIGLAEIQIRLFKDLATVFKQNQATTLFDYRLGTQCYTIPTNQVDYFEVAETGTKTRLHARHEITEFRESLANIVKRWPTLVSINQELLINADNLQTIDQANHTLHFQDGLKLLIMLTNRELQALQKAIS